MIVLVATQTEIPTRDRIVFTSAELFRRQGYAATGLKQISAAAGAPFGSIYHFFPGGKEELGATTLREGGAFFLLLANHYLDEHPDVAEAISEFFDGAAETLRATDYADACPIATIALEVASTSEPLRIAAAGAFDSWLDALGARFEAAGLGRTEAQSLSLAVLSALEGAFILCRAKRTTEPLAAAREMAVAAIRSALAA
jgi:AcrR family transcriptional regulator